MAELKIILQVAGLSAVAAVAIMVVAVRPVTIVVLAGVAEVRHGQEALTIHISSQVLEMEMVK